MRYCIFILSILALVGSFAKPLLPRWDDMHTKHSWKTVPKNWERLGSPPSGTTIDLYIALKSHRENALIDELYEISEPSHPRYGQHLSKEQVAELVAPHPQTLDLVNSWLKHHDIPTSSIALTHGGNTMMLEGVPMNQANALLGASYQIYRHVQTNETIVRTVGYALPAALHKHVQTVAPTTSFTSPPSRWQIPQRNRSGGGAVGQVESESTSKLSSRARLKLVQPSYLRWLYKTANYKPAATDRNMLGIAGFLGDYPSELNFEDFMRKYRSDVVDPAFTVVPVNGGKYNPFKPSMESNLDIQYAAAMAAPTPIIFYSTGRGQSGTDDWYISWLRYILRQSSIPQTISTSYSIDENTCSKEYAVVVCRLFAQLGARGVSILFSTGDHGVGEGNCVTSDGSVQFSPAFPATCPYVTAVGGTFKYHPEVGMELSGGGFSNYFKRPTFQDRAVSSFISNLGNQYQGLYNATGRGIPDIAVQSDDFEIYFKDGKTVVGGTSSSTPVCVTFPLPSGLFVLSTRLTIDIQVAAGIISLLNDYRLSQGRRPLGWLNPWLYSGGFRALTDIKRGSNPGCGTEGFSASVGWDPVTGFGSLDFSEIQKAI
ncbi:subtilisin-like protein [Lactarius quietus]|nr:subtilisin-like protein [Lactarius quietus]